MLDYKIMKNQGEFLLITTDDWFFSKDGNQYKAIWGKCFIKKADEVLGFKPSQSANWYLQVGNDENAVIIAGCRIHYTQICLEKPSGNNVLIIN